MAAVCVALGSAEFEPQAVHAQSRYSTSEAREQLARGSELEGKAETTGDEDLLEEAADAYLEAIDLDPTLVEAYARLGYVLYVLERSEEAVELLASAHERNPEDMRVRHVLGINLYALGREDAAAAHLEKVVAKRDDLPDALFVLGKYHLDRRADEKARALFDRYRELEPDDPQVHRALAALHMRNASWDEALAALDELVDLVPDDVAAHVNRGHVHFQRGAVANAEKSYRRALELAPHRVDVRYHLASLYVRGDDCSNAIRELDAVLEENPDHFGAVYYRAQCALDIGALDDARARFESLVERKPDYAYGYLKLAEIALERGDEDAAEAHLDASRYGEADHRDTIELAGRLLRAMDRPGEARDLHARLVERHPNVAIYHHFLGLDLLAVGTPDAAIRSFEKALELDAELAVATQGLSAALIHDAARLAATGNAEDELDAEQRLERARALDRHPADVRINLALLAMRRDDVDKARVLLAEAREIAPESSTIARLEGALRVRARDYAAAVERLGALAEREPESMTGASWNDLAVAHAEEGDWPAAWDAATKARAADVVEHRNLAVIALHRGLELADAGRWREAADLFDEAGEHDSALDRVERLRLAHAVGLAALHTGRFARAERYLAEVHSALDDLSRRDRRRVAPDGASAVSARLAYARYRSGKPAAALELMGKRPTGDEIPLAAAIEAELGYAAWRDGDSETARKHYERAEKLGVERGGDSAVELGLAAAQYEAGRTGPAMRTFEKLAREGVVEAMLDYAVALDAAGGRADDAMSWYRRYLDAGGERRDEVEARLRVLERVYGPPDEEG